MKNRKNYFMLLILVIVSTFLACSDDVNSKPNFIFKSAPNKTVAAKILGKDLSYDELFKGAESEIYEAEMKVYEIKMNRLRALVLKNLMEADSSYKGDNEAFLAKKIAGKLKISNKQVMAFAKERNIPKENLNDQFKDRIKQFLMREEKAKAVDRWVAKKTRKHPVEVYLTKPTRPVANIVVGNAPFIGKADAKVTVVEFSDFQCPFCSKGAKIMNEIKKKYGSKVKIAFKNYPLPFHSHAKVAAQAALCANDQGTKKFWKMHDAMFADQAKLMESGLIASAKKIGLNEKKFLECLKSGKFAAQVAADMKEGQDAGVKSTPTFFVNGMLVSGAQPLAVFSELIDEELKK